MTKALASSQKSFTTYYYNENGNLSEDEEKLLEQAFSEIQKGIIEKKKLT